MLYKTLKITFIICCLIFNSCGNSSSDKITQPFELSILDYNSKLPYSVLYTISNKELKIIKKGFKKYNKDSILFSINNLPLNITNQITNIKIDSLSVFYATKCQNNNDIKSFQFKKNGKSKKIILQNYYQDELSSSILIINELVPEKYKIQYNKEAIILEMNNCENIEIIDNWKNKKMPFWSIEF